MAREIKTNKQGRSGKEGRQASPRQPQPDRQGRQADRIILVVRRVGWIQGQVVYLVARAAPGALSSRAMLSCNEERNT